MFIQRLDCVVKSLVVKQCNTIRFKGCPKCRTDLGRINEQADFIHVNHGKGQVHRIGVNIFTPQIKGPGNVIQGGHHMAVSIVICHFFAYARKFLFPGFAGIGDIQLKGRGPGDGRPVQPQIGNQVHSGVHTNALLCKFFFQTVGLGRRHHFAVQGNAVIGG